MNNEDIFASASSFDRWQRIRIERLVISEGYGYSMRHITKKNNSILLTRLRTISSV